MIAACMSAAALGIAQGEDVLLQVKDGEQLRMTGTLAEITRPGFCRTFGRGVEPDDPTVFMALRIWETASWLQELEEGTGQVCGGDPLIASAKLLTVQAEAASFALREKRRAGGRSR